MFKAILSDTTPYQEEIQCDRCPFGHQKVNPYCSGNKETVRKSPLSKNNVLYNIRTGNPICKFQIVEEIIGPRRKTGEATILLKGATTAVFPFRTDEELGLTESIIQLVKPDTR